MRIKEMLRSERGDTIIEVLLAMSVIGLVLGSSYAIANRSLQIGREAQERTEALKQVETQFERLRTVSATVDETGSNPLVGFPATSAFCIDSTVTVVEFNRPNFDSFTNPVIDEVEYPEGDDGSRPCNTGTDGRYGITITKSDDVDSYLFTIRARWESLGGGPLQELKTQYRIYPVGNEAFRSIAPPPAPTITPPTLGASITVSDITRQTARATATLESNGRGVVDRMGFVVYESEGQEPQEGRFTDLSEPFEEGEFSGVIDGLNGGTTYYVRSFAQNSSGVVYGETLEEFTTLAPGAPVVGTPNAESISTASMTIRASIDGQGGPINEKGIIVDNPTAAATTVEITGSGGIDYVLRGLLPNTEYEIRAYATNSVSTTTSNPITVQTAAAPSNLSFIGNRNGSAYYASNELVSWTDAKRIAEESGGHLVTFESGAENSYIANIFPDVAWIGLSDSREEGVWEWVTGEPYSYTNWASGEPNDFQWTPEGQDYTVMNWAGPRSGVWDDQDNNERHRFVVEFGASAAPVSVKDSTYAGCGDAHCQPAQTGIVQYQQGMKHSSRHKFESDLGMDVVAYKRELTES